MSHISVSLTHLMASSGASLKNWTLGLATKPYFFLWLAPKTVLLFPCLTTGTLSSLLSSYHTALNLTHSLLDLPSSSYATFTSQLHCRFSEKKIPHSFQSEHFHKCSNRTMLIFPGMQIFYYNHIFSGLMKCCLSWEYGSHIHNKY